MKKTGKNEGGEFHYSVGAIITRKRNNVVEYLMIDRTQIPYGWAGIAGHVEEGDDSLQTLKKEVKEETNLEVVHFNKIFSDEFIEWNKCKDNVPHEWTVYFVDVEGELKIDKREAKAWGWFSAEKLKTMPLEPVWRYFFEKLGII